MLTARRPQCFPSSLDREDVDWPPDHRVEWRSATPVLTGPDRDSTALGYERIVWALEKRHSVRRISRCIGRHYSPRPLAHQGVLRRRQRQDPDHRSRRPHSIDGPRHLEDASTGILREVVMRALMKIVTAFGCSVLVPAAVFAQASITGVVKDSSGAVLPGVTIEA